jgi:hypothetical protein
VRSDWPAGIAWDGVDKIPERFFAAGPNTLADVLRSGNGGFGGLPISLIDTLRTTLKRHGVDVYELSKSWRRYDRQFKALLFGNSHVVAERFDAERWIT